MIIAESEEHKYCVQLSNGTAKITADVTKDKGGSGDYFRPHDLICAGYASCLNINVCMILEKKALKYERVITTVDLNRDLAGRTIFLHHIEIIGDIDTAAKEAVIFEALNCPVQKTLSQNIEFQPALPLTMIQTAPSPGK
ncbi:MAG: OsmC family protein [Firmicutes bacterium]|nr:OsmC family protein [Bacillota bacterium]